MAGNYMVPASVGGYVPTIANANQNFAVFFGAQGQKQWEVISQSLYDSASYAAAGAVSLSFFSQPVGQGTGFGGGAKSVSDTNMLLAGQLPSNQAFLVRQIEIQLQPTTPTVAGQLPADFGAQAAANIVNDAFIIRRSGHLNLTIGSKAYLSESPLMRFPPTSNFRVDGALADATSPAAASQSRLAFADAVGQPYVLTPNNLMITGNSNFNVTLSWPEGLQAITNPARLFVVMNGLLYRQVQ